MASRFVFLKSTFFLVSGVSTLTSDPRLNMIPGEGTGVREKGKRLLSYLQEEYVRWSSARLDRKMCGNDAYWVFILGVNNSGTTILAKLLETHPEVRALPAEGQHLTTAFPRPDLLGCGRLWSSRMDVFRWSKDHDPMPALRAKKDWMKLYSKDKGILLEKSPPNTVRSLWLQRNFTPSRFLAIIRSPYAVCEGIRRRKEYNLHQAAAHWNTANTCLLGDLQQIEKKLLVKYEDLVEDTQETLAKIERFLELERPFDLDDSVGLSAHSIEGTTTGLRNLNEESMSRLSQADIYDINTICGDLMRQLGYSLR